MKKGLLPKNTVIFLDDFERKTCADFQLSCKPNTCQLVCLVDNNGITCIGNCPGNTVCRTNQTELLECL